MIDWIDFGLVRDFATAKTDAYRLCTKQDAWAERYGADVLVSIKPKPPAIASWRAENGRGTDLMVERVFARYLPKNAERRRETIAGDASAA
jgi:hypothetical protein